MSRSTIEKVKNISLVALFFSTVLLLYFFWGNISFDRIGLTGSTDISDVPKAELVVKPDKIVINFGNNNYTVITSRSTAIWYDPAYTDSMAGEFNSFGQAGDILVEEITYDKYETVTKYRSIWTEFAYDIPMADFCTIFDIKKPSGYDGIETVTAVGYSTAVDKSIFIYDGKNHKYYRLVADSSKANSADFAKLISKAEGQGYTSYYPVSVILGDSVVNSTLLVPDSVATNLNDFSFRQDTYPNETAKITSIAKNFFGNLDFVRTITEDKGTVIYMYGYGQNVLIVNTDGSIEYKEEQVSGSPQPNFLDALNLAMQYVEEHGTWKSLNGAKLTPYLKDVTVNPNKKRGYQFVFGMEINGNRLFYEDGDPIVITVTSGQVTYYKRNMIDFDQEALSSMETYSPESAYSSVNLIAQNYQYIYNVLLQTELISTAVAPDDMFETIAAMVTNMQTGYLRLADTGITEIQPVWIVSVEDVKIYFDLYTAQPLSYSKGR
ncbi:MAG: hypothetical protein K0Q48_1542 [Bacillota bacterium]|nr:hypothetical protein [Bacillota bacterium]